jgi:hypothetical protein
MPATASHTATAPRGAAWYDASVRGSLGIGLVIGALVGAGGMYVALRPPWASHDTPPTVAPVVAAAPVDAGVGKPKHKRGGHRSGRGAGGATQSGDESGWGDTGGDGDQGPIVQLVPLTAADRVLEWRGDDTSRPPQKIDMANGADARSLDDGEIQQVIASQSEPAQRCVTTAATNTDLKGTITVKLVVDGNGRVIKSKVQAFHYMFEHGLLGCMQHAVAGIKFPATGASTLVTLPVNFS